MLINLNKSSQNSSALITNSISYTSLRGLVVPLQQGEACSLHFSIYTRQIIVGYSDGLVVLIEINAEDISDPQKQAISPKKIINIDSQKYHNSPITFITTVPITQNFEEFDRHSTRKFETLLIIGDTEGKLSFWKVSIKEKEKDKKRYYFYYFYYHYSFI